MTRAVMIVAAAVLVGLLAVAAVLREQGRYEARAFDKIGIIVTDRLTGNIEVCRFDITRFAYWQAGRGGIGNIQCTALEKLPAPD